MYTIRLGGSSAAVTSFTRIGSSIIKAIQKFYLFIQIEKKIQRSIEMNIPFVFPSSNVFDSKEAIRVGGAGV
jgi:hypothetical protein